MRNLQLRKLVSGSGERGACGSLKFGKFEGLARAERRWGYKNVISSSTVQVQFVCLRWFLFSVVSRTQLCSEMSSSMFEMCIDSVAVRIVRICSICSPFLFFSKYMTYK